jgi:hypothetical protein
MISYQWIYLKIESLVFFVQKFFWRQTLCSIHKFRERKVHSAYTLKKSTLHIQHMISRGALVLWRYWEKISKCLSSFPNYVTIVTNRQKKQKKIGMNFTGVASIILWTKIEHCCLAIVFWHATTIFEFRHFTQITPKFCHNLAFYWLFFRCIAWFDWIIY